MPWAQDVSPDGKTVMVQDPFSATRGVYFYDVATKQLTLQFEQGSDENDIAWALSSNGAVAGNFGDTPQAGIWSQAGGLTTLPTHAAANCDAFSSIAWDVSADGSSVAGMDWNGACQTTSWIWSTASGTPVWTALDTLGTLFPGDTGVPSNRAIVISNDGSTIGGTARNGALSVDRAPAIWHADGSGFMIPTGGVFADDCPGEVLALSPDGSMAAGTWCQNAYSWTQAGGVVDLGRLPTTDPTDEVYANAIAANGKLIFGTSGNGFFGIQQPWVWTAATGMRDLTSVLKQYFVQVPAGYYLATVRAASADGTVVIGQAYSPEGLQVTYVLTVPVSAYGL